MDSNTIELYSALENGPYDEAGLNQVKRLLSVERRVLRANHDFTALEQLIPMLQHWAAAAGGGWLSASALAEAIEIAELDLRNTARAEELRTQAITTGRTASGTPIPLERHAEHTQEVHTIDLEVGATPSMLPLENDDALTAEIAHAEHVLETDSSPERVRELAELYAMRGKDRDRENAAQLYCTLGEMLGNPAGVPMLERAIALIPEHTEAKALLMRYAVRPRRVSSPKITLLGAPAPRPIPQPPPPSAAAVSAAPAKPSGITALAPLQPPAAAGNGAVSPPLPSARKTTPLPSLAAAENPKAALAPKTAAGAALSNAAARISSRPPAARVSSRPPGRRSSTSPGVLTASAASTAIAEDDRAIPMETVAAESVPPVAVAAPSRRPLPAAVAQQDAAAHESVTPLAVPELEPANDGGRASQVHEAPDVLQLHGIPQVKTMPPTVPEISSLTPFVRSDASELQAKGIPKNTRQTLITGGVILSAAAAFGLYIASQSKDSNAALPPTAAVATTAKTSAATQPQAAPTPTPPPAPITPANVAEPAAVANAPEPEAAAQPEVAAVATPEPQPTAANAKAGAPAPLAPPGPSHLPVLKLDSAKVKGGKLNETQLAQALSKAEPKLLACYAQAVEHKPKLKGKILYSFSIRPNGRATSVKRAGGTLKDDAVFECSTKVLENVHFPKPRKQATQVKLGIQYKRT